MLQRRFFLCLLACFLHCPLYSRSEDVGFPLTDYSVLHPSTLSQGDVVFRETLNFNGFCNVNFAVELSGEGREIFETERNGLEIIVTLVNTSALEETDYQLNITVNGTYTACTSMGSTSSTAATSATSDAIEPTPSLSSFTTQMMSSQSAANVMESQNVSSSESTTSVTPSLQTTPTGSSSESTTSVTPSLQTTPTGSSSESTTSVTPSLQTTPTGSSSDSTTSVTPSPTGSDIEVTMTETMSSSSPSPASPTMFSSSAGLLVRIVPPVTIAATTPTTLFPTEVASFNCSYWNSSALVDFEWYVDDVQDNETGPTFSFQVKLSNNGSLVRCQVGNDSSPSISLQITNPMVTLSTQPDANNSVSLQGTTYDSVFAANGDTVDVTCSLNSGPVFELLVVTSSYMVQENGSLLNGEESTLSSNGTGRVNVSESTSVFCRALVDGEVFESRTIIIAVVPYNLTIEASPGVQVEYTAGLNLTCNAMGGPTLNFSWVLPNGMEEDGSVLLVDMVTEMEDGEYVCTVTSEAGNTSVSISVQVGLALMMEPSPLLVDSGDVVNFTCEASGSDPITYQWLKDGTVLPESSRVSGTNSTTLTIIPVESQDFGNYSCNVSNPVNSLLSRPALLTVSPRNLVTVTPIMILTNQSDDEMFTCESGGGPGNSFQWYLNGELLLNETSSNISITMVTASDAGEYNCTVTNAAGGGSDVATLIVGLALVMQPSPLLVDSGDVVNFTCEASGSDPITYQWLKDGTVLPESSRVSGTNSTTLTIIPVESQDFGNYSCNVSNPVNSLLSTTALLTVSPRNLVNVTSTVILTNQSDDEMFTCESGGGPGNSFQWYLNGELLLNETSPVINITMVMASDAGEYNCTVTNAAGGGSDVATLSVVPYNLTIEASPGVQVEYTAGLNLTCNAMGGPTLNFSWVLPNGMEEDGSVLLVDMVTEMEDGEYVCTVTSEAGNTSVSISVQVGLALMMEPSPLLVDSGDMVNFTCEASGSDPITYQWLKDGTVLPESSRVSGTNSTTLTIIPVESQDFGNYSCNVSNPVNSLLSRTALLTVSPRNLVTITPMMILTNQSDDEIFTCESGGGPGNSFQWYLNGELLLNETSSNISITMVTASDAGEYNCTVTNAAGGGSDVATLIVGLQLMMEPSSLLVNSGDVVNFTCEASGSDPITYQWLKDGTVLPESSRVSGINSTTLTIIPVESQDFGDYSCNVSNPVNSLLSRPALLTVSPRNLVNVTSTMILTNQSDDEIFTCESGGGPGNSFQWYLNGKLLLNETSPVINITMVMASDAGEYNCTVTNAAGGGSDVATLIVGLALMMEPSSLLVDSGDMVNFTCEASGSDPITYQWLKDGTVLPESSRVSGTNSTTLTIIPVESQDFGNYSCNVSNPVNSLLSRPALLTVSPRNLVNVTSTMILTNQSDDEIFTCESGGGPGNSFQWYLNGEFLLNETSSVINITMVMASDAGEYNCTVTNAAGGGSDVAMLIVGVVIDSPPSDVLTNTSTSVTFTCGVSGSEPIDYTWFLGNGTQVESTNRITGTNTSMLTIDDVVSSDYGEYFCSASNAVNRQRSENALLTVSPLGSVVVQQVNFTVNETDNVTFMCSGEGGPGNRFAWLFNGTSLSNATVLAVRNISAEDGGDYICEVSNAAGSGRQTGRIFVNPVLVTDPVGANVPILTSYSLLCEARGFPPPTIIWFQNNTNISQNEARTITTTITGVVVRSQLTLLNATFDDSGAYQCVALANHPGGFLVGSDTVNITVQSIPERPVNVTVADVAPRSVLLKWIEPHDNNAEITDYEVEVQDDTDSNSPPVTQRTMGAVEMLNVTGLKPFNNYTFVVFANNSLGRSPPSAPVTTQTDESIPTAPLNLTSVNVGSLSISISWERPSSPNGVLLSYLVTYVRTDNNTVFTLTTPPTVRAANLTLLTAFVTYNITVRANTSVGFGPDSAPLIVLTQPAVPSEIRDITIMNTSSTSVRVTFNVPSPPNGIILAYEVNITRASTPRSRRAAVEDITVDEQMLLRNVSNDTREINIGGFEKFSENTICLRAFSQVGGGVVTCMTFVTSEDVPLPPMNVEVFNVSSKSLNVTWDKPMFVHGILLAYEIAYVSSDGSSNAINKTDGFESSNSMVLDGLTINTQYNISVRAYTSAGPGVSDSALGMTNEDAPPRIASFNVTQPTTGSGELVLTWTPPTTRNGDYTYLLSYSFKSAFTHTERIENGNETIPLDRTMMNGADIASFIIMNTSDTERRVRSFADYTFSISGCNILFGNCNAPSMETIRTEVTRATPVTNLIAVPLTSGSDNPPSFDIKVTWDLPLFPNGEITNYEIHYFPSLSPGDRKSTMVDVSQTTFFINTSTPHTNYTIEVIPVSRNANGFSHTVIQRTNQSAPLPSDIGNPSEMGISYTSITVVVPVPSEDTGVIRVFDVLVVGPNAGDLDTSLYLERSGLERVRRALTIDNPDGIPGLVPPRVREANPLEVGGLEPNSRYLIFTRTEYFMDGTTLNVVFSSPFAVTTLNSGLTAGLVIFFFLLVLIIVGLVVVIVFLLLRRRRKSYDPGLADIPLSPTDADKPNVYVNLSIPQWTATMDPVSIQEFPDHVRQLHADDDYRFSEEYKNVEPDHSPTVEAFSNSANATKNRYGNITSYDHSRVRLKPVEGVAGSDYINANFIDGYRMPSAFIATQGPVPDSIKDFWRMVWEQNSPTIIMLTNLEERGRVKCHKYWPAKTDSYGDIRVSQQDEVVLTEYTVRTFSVIKSGFREERIITQYHYTSWPDFGVPSYPTPLLTFVRRVSANHPADKGPMVVHCSAGVGRSGTFITVLSQLKRMAAESNLDIYGFVRAMRHRRCLMVQTEAQYIFLHDALLEAIECGITEVQARDLPSHYKKLQATDEATGKTLLEMELQRLNTSIHKKPAQSEGIKPTNRGKNRFADILPYDTTRCRLSSVIGVSGSDYINANFINGYTTKNAFIATQGPLPDTTGDFWRMVWENKCHTVIMLTKEKEGGRVRCHKYWPDGNDMYGQIQVVHISETPYSEFILREFKLIDTKDKSSLPLKHFQFLGWPEESGKVPEHGADVIDLIGQVQKWQRTAGTAPVVVHCSGGSGRTGTFITIANLLDCLKSEGVVDVFQTVRTLRLQRPNMVRTVEQYRYCYTTVLEYLESFDLYANFK